MSPWLNSEMVSPENTEEAVIIFSRLQHDKRAAAGSNIHGIYCITEKPYNREPIIQRLCGFLSF